MNLSSMVADAGVWPYVFLVVAYSIVDRTIFAATGAPTMRNRQEWT